MTMTETRQFSPSRRSILKGGAALLASPAVLGSAGARGAAKELRIMMAGGSWKDYVSKTFAEPFAQANNLELVWKLGLSMEPTIMAQQRRPQWDCVHTGQSKAEQLGSMGLYRPWTEDRIPNLAKIHPSFKYQFVAGKCHTPYGLLVNTKQIKGDGNAWAELWNPEYKGKVGFPAWNWMGEEVFYTINTLHGGTPENIDPGVAKMKELFTKNDAKFINNVEHTRQMVEAGEVWIAPHFGARIEQIAAAGTPVEFRIPKEGGLSFVWNTALVANRPPESMEMTDKFVNTTLETERQIEFAKLTGYPPTNLEAIKNLPASLKKVEFSEADLELLGKLQRQQDFMAQFAYRDQNAERWNKEVVAAK
jgi:putative spermidine/putrescine transport system substrate-binding protein